MNENDYQKALIIKLKKTLPGCIILKNDSRYIQGIPDLSVLYLDKYFMLEVKRSSKAHRDPNQVIYVDKFNAMGGYARFIYPENEKEIFDEIISISGAQRT